MNFQKNDYYRIQANIKEAEANGNRRKLHLWRGKLEKWQQWYGAYVPIK